MLFVSLDFIHSSETETQKSSLSHLLLQFGKSCRLKEVLIFV